MYSRIEFGWLICQSHRSSNILFCCRWRPTVRCLYVTNGSCIASNFNLSCCFAICIKHVSLCQFFHHLHCTCQAKPEFWQNGYTFNFNNSSIWKNYNDWTLNQNASELLITGLGPFRNIRVHLKLSNILIFQSLLISYFKKQKNQTPWNSQQQTSLVCNFIVFCSIYKGLFIYWPGRP